MLTLGIDIGTSGLRAAVVKPMSWHVVKVASNPFSPGSAFDPFAWRAALATVLDGLAGSLLDVESVIVAGTSGTIVAVDAKGDPVSGGSAYHARCSGPALAIVDRLAPPGSPARGATSPLARAVDFLRDHPHARIFHQADFVLAELTGGLHVSDENNALKTGYDPVLRRWPDWVAAAGLNAASLPAVVPAGTRVSQISRQIAARFGFNRKAVVVAGTTDGCAAFLAAGGRAVGDAVTSIGSTLVLKVAGAEPICDPLSGVYSHRLGEIWLAGGASNSGGAALLKHFTPEEMTRLEPLMRPETPSGLSYYPLPGTGERFPETNPERQSEVMPIPDDRAVFLQGLFEGIASIEAAGYGKLQSLGLPRPSRIASTGKTAANDALRRIRERTLCMSLPPASRADVCVGVARLVSMDHQRRDPGANLA